MQLDPDFREFVESFNAHEVRYLVVGGYALAAHGLPRALTAFGFGGVGLEVADFDRPDSIVQLGYPQDRADVQRLRGDSD